MVIFWLARKKEGQNSAKKPSAENDTISLQNLDAGCENDFSVGYASLKKQSSFSVSQDYDHLNFHPPSTCPLVTYAAVERGGREQNVAFNQTSNSPELKLNEVKN